ncbi:MAG: TIGR03915 family putative DNA repair protein [Treponema sp.]|nr:TIGR03915 family putative DNA repair protein [Treponema sp.]
MHISLVQLFAYISGSSEYTNAQSLCVSTGSNNSGELFGEYIKNTGYLSNDGETDCAIVAGLHSETGINFNVLPPDVYRLYEHSADAFDVIVHAWMSELPVTAAIIRFGRKTLAAADAVDSNGATERNELESRQRQAAHHAATDRGDLDVQAVHDSAYKVWHEIHRLMGLLRFCPNDGVYTAHCEPDHFILPALGPHFKARFGETPWEIIDEKRRLCMRCVSGEMVNIINKDNNAVFTGTSQDGMWENLWRNYHKTINNPGRNNPDLQKQFMPKRYWKYLTEMKPGNP